MPPRESGAGLRHLDGRRARTRRSRRIGLGRHPDDDRRELERRRLARGDRRLPAHGPGRPKGRRRQQGLHRNRLRLGQGHGPVRVRKRSLGFSVHSRRAIRVVHGSAVVAGAGPDAPRHVRGNEAAFLHRRHPAASPRARLSGIACTSGARPLADLASRTGPAAKGAEGSGRSGVPASEQATAFAGSPAERTTKSQRPHPRSGSDRSRRPALRPIRRDRAGPACGDPPGR